jgi:hypothetical protein
MSVEDRVIKLETFAADVREHTRILTALLERHSERMDNHDAALAEMHAAQANADARIAALADAQIRTEDALRRLIERDEQRGNGSGGQ